MEAINNETLTKFCGGQTGNWKVISMHTLKGPTLEPVHRISILNHPDIRVPDETKWSLKGITSNLRYTHRNEKTTLDATPSVLGKPNATYAALIPLKKSPEWWLLTQDERRNIFEDQSKHIHYSLKYLPIISRKLYHSKDIGEPFDFLTWFEFAPEHADSFKELLDYLRQSEEWKYVVREIDIRLERERN